MKISYRNLFKLSYNFLLSSGVPAHISKIVSNHLVTSDMSGHFSHGTLRLIQYFNGISSKLINPKATPEIKKKNNLIIVNSKRCFGHYAMLRGLKEIIKSKKDMSLLAVNNCSHIGRLSDYLNFLCNENYVSLIFCNGGGPNSAIYPSAERICGTNPFGFGMPITKKKNVIVDFSTSMLAEGKVRVENIKNKKLYTKAIIDKNGLLTNDPKKFYLGGALAPFGGKKGSGLMLTCELLGGLLLSQNNPINKDYLDGNNCLVIAFKKDLFKYNEKHFYKQYEKFAKKINNSKKLSSIDKKNNFLPGEWENKNIKLSKKQITIDDKIINEIKNFAKKKNLKID